MAYIDELYERLLKVSPELARDVATVLREGLVPKAQVISDDEIIEQAKQAVSRWLSPTQGIVVRGDVPPSGNWQYIWQVARGGEGGPITLNPSELEHIGADDPMLLTAVTESRVTKIMKMPVLAFIFRAEMDPEGWTQLFQMLAAGMLPLVLTTSTSHWDTINILIGG
jgi:hypothetical protein